MPARPLSLLLAVFALLLAAAPQTHAAWTRHTIDGPDRDKGKSGADGVRLADVNGDALMDITTGWEQGGAVRVYLNPGPDKATEPWPAVTVGNAKGVEDAVFADLDADGNIDVVSSTEGKNRTVYFHWAPADKDRYLDPAAWTTEPVPATAGEQMWMFALPADLDDKNGIDIVLGSKSSGAAMGWLESPENPRETAAWQYHKMHDAAWIMSIRAIASESNLSLVYSDRKGDDSGVFLLEQSTTPHAPWTRTLLAGGGTEVMFLDLTKDDENSLLVARKEDSVLAPDADYSLPKKAGTGKAARWLDVNLDQSIDIVLTCENAKGNLSGVWWRNGATGKWTDISGPEGVKYDRIELLDLDEDGDQDLITCEERTDLGVIWYENPTNATPQ